MREIVDLIPEIADLMLGIAIVMLRSQIQCPKVQI